MFTVENFENVIPTEVAVIFKFDGDLVVFDFVGAFCFDAGFSNGDGITLESEFSGREKTFVLISTGHLAAGSECQAHGCKNSKCENDGKDSFHLLIPPKIIFRKQIYKLFTIVIISDFESFVNSHF